MTRRILPALAAVGLCVLTLPASAYAANPTQLLLSQSSAFAVLGHSCGGIQEQVYATGFSPASGDPLGDAYLSTSCGGSGRGGGYKSTTYSAWVSVTWDFGGNVLAYARLTTAPTVNPALSVFDAHGDQVYNQTTRAYLVVVLPAAPTGVNSVMSGGQYRVSWVPDPTAAAQITSSAVTATPVGSTAPVVTAGVRGSATSVLLGPLQPQTIYQITVMSNDAAGSSPASSPIQITTGASSTPPGAPTGVSARWTAPGYTPDPLAASWLAGTPGDSPTDEYQITISGSDGGGTFTQTVSGSTLSATFGVSDIPDWRIQVRAHDVAGWSPWSAAFTLGGN